MGKTRPIIERYERNINRTATCWEWTKSLSNNGYAQIRVGRPGNGPVWLVHRWAYQHFVGPIPEGMMVLHRCDNRKCSNPEHLYVGTQADNMRDRSERHPNARGYKRPFVPRKYKLTDDQVRAIRIDVRPNHIVAVAFNVSENHVSNIRHRLRKQHVPD